jgi:NADPH:quinone reductase-like Zn-dependent oxidoreductase
MRAYALNEVGTHGAIIDLPVPEPEAGQVRVRIAASSVNPGDVAMVNGLYKNFMEYRFPLVPGSDLSGTVDAVGPGVTTFKEGDRVFGIHGKPFVGGGAMAEYTIALEGTIAQRPVAADDKVGAALPLVGVSALQCVDAARLQRGDVIVILAAAGGIGSFSMQLAKAAGAHVIAAVSPRNFDYVRARGADETIDYTSADVYAAVQAKHPGGIAALLALRGSKEDVSKLGGLVHGGGHVVSMIGAADANEVAKRNVSATNVRTMVTTAALNRLTSLLSAGTISAPEIKTYSLDQTGEAFDEVGAAHVRGKVVVTV